ncbi:MAG: lytic transglycosylase domain-containing protein [Terriglobia bacterium]
MRWGVFLVLVAAVCPLASAQGPPAPREYAIRCVEHYAHIYQVPVELVESVIDVESNWNPSAVSPKGAVGLMQLMPGTAFKFGVKNRFRIEENVRGGVAYLAWLIELFRGDLRLVMGAYVAGQNRMLSRGLSYSSREVYEYVSNVARQYHWRRIESIRGGKS